MRGAFDLGGPVPAVPSCPSWSVTDLVRHLGGVHRYLAHVLRGRLTIPPDPAGLTLPEPRDGPDALIDRFAEGAGEPAELFHELGPDTTARTWSAEQTSGFRLRMQLIEPAVHRWDAESATGTPGGLAPDLAADAVTRTIEVMAPARRGWRQAPPGAGETYRFRRTDGPESWTVLFSGDQILRVPGFTGPAVDVAAAGSACDLSLFRWGRLPPTVLRVQGDAALLPHRFTLVPPVRGPGRRARPGRVPGCGPPDRKTRAATYHGGMSFLRRHRAATPAGPDFDVLAMDPGDWPGNLGAGLLPAPDGSCQGVFLRYDLFGGRGPAMIIGNLPEGSPARDLTDDQIPFEVAQLLDALENDEDVEVTGVEDCPVMQGDNLLIVRKIKLSESRISCVQFDRSDNVLVTIASWDRPITDDLYALLKPLPAELFQQG